MVEMAQTHFDELVVEHYMRKLMSLPVAVDGSAYGTHANRASVFECAIDRFSAAGLLPLLMSFMDLLPHGTIRIASRMANHNLAGNRLDLPSRAAVLTCKVWFTQHSVVTLLHYWAKRHQSCTHMQAAVHKVIFRLKVGRTSRALQSLGGKKKKGVVEK